MAKIETGTWKDLKEAKEQLGIGEPPPSGLVPIGDTGLYTTPNTPADPRDCDRYPDSPFCGGNPVDLRPIGIDISTTVQANPCGVTRSVTATATLLGLKLPPVSAAYIPENCREEYENQGKQKPPDPPPSDLDGYQPTPQFSPYGFNADDIVCVVTQDQYISEERAYYRYFSDKWLIALSKANGNVSDTYYPTGTLIPSYRNSSPVKALAIAKGISTGSVFFNKEYANFYRISNTDYYDEDIKFVELNLPPDYPTVQEIYGYPKFGKYKTIFDYITSLAQVHPIQLYVGRFGDIFPTRQISPIQDSYTETFYQGNAETRRIIHERFVVYCEKIGRTPDRFPPPPRPPKKECCEDNMGCCQPSNNNKNDQDLEEIKKMLRELKKRIGVDEYPVKMPASLNADYNSSGKKSEPGTVTEENLTTVLGRFIRYFDGVMGEFGVGFKVADADPTKPGDQPKFISAPNVAELMSEMYAHIFDMWIMQYQHLQLNQRHAIESMLGRKVGIQNYFLLEALIDWAGFKRKDITKKVPFLFDIDAKEFEGFLKNKEQEIQIVDFDPEDKNTESFPDHLMRLKRAAAIIEAVHTRKFKKDDDIPQKIKDILSATTQSLDRINNDELRNSTSKEDFDQWLRDAETAFINRIGQGDLNNPYGVPYANRPKLTKIHDSLEGGESDES